MSAPSTSRHWILKNKPTGLPTLSGDHPTFVLEKRDVPKLSDDQVLLKTLYISNDPAQRGWISAGVDPARLYAPPVPQDAPMTARVIGEVLESSSSKFKKGQHVTASGSWSEYLVVSAAACQPIPDAPGLNLEETHYLGALGLTGLTAYYGIKEIAETKASDVVMVSGAAGATGSMVVQIAKHLLGCRTVLGLAGSDDKCRWVESLGADRCLNYKSATFAEDLRAATPHFVDVFFDNVGGDTLDRMLTRMGRHSRVAACGAISTYNGEKTAGIRNWFEVISMRISIRGFIVLDYRDQAERVVGELVRAAKEGKIKITGEGETVIKSSFEEVPNVWLKLFQGSNQGKLVTDLSRA